MKFFPLILVLLADLVYSQINWAPALYARTPYFHIVENTVVDRNLNLTPPIQKNPVPFGFESITGRRSTITDFLLASAGLFMIAQQFAPRIPLGPNKDAMLGFRFGMNGSAKLSMMIKL